MYTEDEITLENPRQTIAPLRDCSGWQEFQDDTAHIEPRSYLFDARKFSNKVFAQVDAFNDAEERYIVWVDGDVLFHADFDAKFFKDLVKGYFCAYLGRGKTYTETGMIIFDMDHPDFDEFAKRYESFYLDRTLFLLPYWIDCLAFDTARQGLEAKDLTPEVSGMVDVFSRSPLAEICSHDKGARKYKS